LTKTAGKGKDDRKINSTAPMLGRAQGEKPLTAALDRQGMRFTTA
jgi:hypothetical protein